MAYIFNMPDVGEGMAEGEIVQWDVKVGDTVKEEDTLVEIQNDKSVEEIVSPIAGTITKLFYEEGDMAEVGKPLIEFDGDGSGAGAETAAAAPAEAAAPAAPAAAGTSYYKFLMPDVGEGMAEGEIADWLVSEGDTVDEETSIVEIQNDKSVEEVASPVAGTIKKIYHVAGDVVNVGDVLAEIDSPEHNGENAEAPLPVSVEAVEADAPAAAQTPASASPAPAAGPVDPNRMILAMPSVRQHARDLGIDLAQVPGSGANGRITKADVDAFKAGGAPVAEAAAPAPAASAAAEKADQPTAKKAAPVASGDYAALEEHIKMTPMRKAIKKSMETSAYTAPQVTLMKEVEVTKLWNHRKKFKGIAAERGTKLTFLPYAVKALIAAVKKFPALNASVDDDNMEFIYKHYYNVGIATDTDAGLYVPNIKDADKKSMFDIADEITELAGKAHAGDLSAEEMRHGTVTISNIGSVGGEFFTPILNYPEVAILGFGGIKQQPVINEDGNIVPGRVLKLSLVFDHRIVDGATGQKALNEICRLLADPELLLMES